MKRILLSTAFLLLAGNAYALNDDINTANGNSQAFQNTGSMAGNTVNVGAGAGSLLSGGAATATGGAGGAVTASGNSFNALQGGSQTASTGSQSVNVEADRVPVSTAYTAALAASAEACMGSSSAAGQGVGFGLSLGSTWENEKCNARKDAAVWVSLNERGVAVARMRQVAENEAAYRAAHPNARPLPVATSVRADTPAYPALANTDSPKH